MHETIFRRALRGDLERIVTLLADDPLGSQRERPTFPLKRTYLSAFDAIDGDPRHELIVLDIGQGPEGVMQLSYLPSLTYEGRERAQVEGVRVSERLRGQGYGEKMFRWAIERAGKRGCVMVQLTTDKSRPEALRFYERLGFRASHEGMKLHLTDSRMSPEKTPE
jgi:ribosomal protein S18 acetylase RimI-like enzyme